MTSFADPDHVPDFRRDQWGRPSIMQPNGKRKGYTRCSSAAKTIEDTYNLEKWARRNVAYGLAYDASLVARIIAIGGEPASWGKAEKDQVNAIIEAADAVAKAHKRADMGTAVHHMTHRADRGEEVNAGPYQADLDAYTAAIRQAGLVTDPRYIECKLVNDALEMAGSADRIYFCPATGRYRIGDIKTGATVDFGGLGWSAQEAAYAGGKLYDTEREVRLDTPEMDQEVGLIIHLPAGEGRCTIFEVDIAQGLKAAVLANEIRATRKASKTWITPVTKVAAPPPPEPAPPETGFSSSSPVDESHKNASAGPGISDDPGLNDPATAGGQSDKAPADDPRRTALLARYAAMSDDEKFAYCALHIDGDDLDAVEAGLEQVDVFNTHVEYVPPQPTESPALPSIPDEGAVVADNDVEALKARFDALSDSAKLWTGTMIAQGRLSHHWRITDTPTTRRYELYRGVMALAEWDDDGVDDIITCLVRLMLPDHGPEAILAPGEALGLLDADQAIWFAELAHDLTTDRLAVSVDDDGTLRLHAVA